MRLEPILEDLSGVRVEKDDLCPCDSGLKYKKCCGKH
ncbi:MAG: hypothetical protein GTN40_03695 [Candidatus Aenigmarchaeota archaeon]|nr:hypothetical protein [Candidatus Aenigmarchaeota archaeon]